MRIISKNQQKTFELGTKIAKNLKGGDILAVSGGLGAGKTVLIKGIATGLGVKQTVRSPSFNLMKVYLITKTLKHKNTKTQKQLIHLDCYRLKSSREVIEIGLLDYLGRPDAVVVIEWPEKIIDLLKKRRLKNIKFKILKSDIRQISIF